MNKQQIRCLSIVLAFVFIFSSSCAPRLSDTVIVIQLPSETLAATATLTADTIMSTSPTAAVTEVIPVTGHLMSPAQAAPPPGRLVYDVQSSGDSAPYGDSYDINRFERPFLSDMTYIPELDIVTFNLAEDADWYYISMELSGDDPNNPVGIHYGVELDVNADGFGDFIIWAQPPYTTEWSTSTVKVYEDTDQDTAGVSSAKSDAVFEGNGYDTLIFDGAAGQTDDPDLAWVRINAGPRATVQFAFKKSLTGPAFMAGVVADAGLKDVTRYDYNNYFRQSRAGSPIRSSPNYPLGSVYAVDNTCWQAYGMRASIYQPKFCPPAASPNVTNTAAEVLSEDRGATPTNTPPPPATNTSRPPATNTSPPPPPPTTETSPPPPPPPTTETSPPPPPPPTTETSSLGKPSRCNPPPPCENYHPVTCECR